MTLSANRPSRVKQNLLQAVTNQDEGKKKRLNANIDENLFKKIKAKAAEEGRTISDITTELWIEYLSK